MEREYCAIVHGTPDPLAGTWESFLVETGNYHVKSIKKPAEEAKQAITHYETVKKNKSFALLRIHLETGRKNQIRVHASEAGTPIIGDAKYGSTINPIHRLALHARLLGFTHPETGNKLRFTSPIPSSFTKLF